MTAEDFAKLKDELANIRAAANGVITTHIDVTFHLTNGDVISVGSSTIDPSDNETTRVEWETSSPKLENGVIRAYDYPRETRDNPNFETNVTYGTKKSYTFPLDAVLYWNIDWSQKKIVPVENGSTANVAAE